MSRYELERFEPRPDPDLICAICQSVLDKPLQTKCSHVFCEICIETWLTDRQTCPNCRNASKKRDLKPVLPILRNLLNRLKVHCKYYQNGCEPLFVMEYVLNHETDCEFEPVPCCYAKCTANVTRKSKSDHEKNCEYREVQCKETCGLMVLVNDTNHDCLLALKAHVSEQQTELNKLRARAQELEELKTSLEGQLSQVQQQLNDRDRNSDLSDWPTLSSSEDERRIRTLTDLEDNIAEENSYHFGRTASYHAASSSESNIDYIFASDVSDEHDEDRQSYTASTPEFPTSPQTSHVLLFPNSPRSPERTPSLSPSHYSRSAEPTPVPSPAPDVFEDVPSSPGASSNPAFSPEYSPGHYSSEDHNGSDNDHSRVTNTDRSNSDGYYSSARESGNEVQNVYSEGSDVDNETDRQDYSDNENDEHCDSDRSSLNSEHDSGRQFPCYNSNSESQEEEEEEDSTTVTSGSDHHDNDNNEDTDSTLGDNNHDNRWSGSENSGSRTPVYSDKDDRSDHDGGSDNDPDSSSEERNTDSSSDCQDRDAVDGFDPKESDKDEDNDHSSETSKLNKEKHGKNNIKQRRSQTRRRSSYTDSDSEDDNNGTNNRGNPKACKSSAALEPGSSSRKSEPVQNLSVKTRIPRISKHQASHASANLLARWLGQDTTKSDNYACSTSFANKVSGGASVSHSSETKSTTTTSTSAVSFGASLSNEQSAAASRRPKRRRTMSEDNGNARKRQRGNNSNENHRQGTKRNQDTTSGVNNVEHFQYGEHNTHVGNKTEHHGLDEDDSTSDSSWHPSRSTSPSDVSISDDMELDPEPGASYKVRVPPTVAQLLERYQSCDDSDDSWHP